MRHRKMPMNRENEDLKEDDYIGPALWFTPPGQLIGMVLVRQPTGRFRGYVGNAPGIEEIADRLYIAQRGARLPAKVLSALFSINPELAE